MQHEKTSAILLIATIATVALPLFAVANVWYPMVPMSERSLLAAVALTAFFLTRESPNRTVRAFDLICAALSAISFGYVVIYWQELLMRQGLPTQADLAFGCLGISLIFVATARCFGTGLTVIVVLFLAYSFLGQYLPAWLGGHRGYSYQRIFTFIFSGENGVLGFAIDAALKYMALFLVLGKVLEHSGALTFIMNFSRAVLGRGTSGPPLMSVLSSGMVGTVTGSSMANVYITGNVTIPLMKRSGIRPELAAAIEATASNGSQILPPVMGFAVFFMIVMIDASYVDIITAALIPGILYYVTLGFAVWLRTRRVERSPIVEDEPPRMTWVEALRSNGALVFILTLGTLVFFLLRRDSIQMAAIYSICVCLTLSMFGSSRYTPRKIFLTLKESGQEVTEVVVVCLALGLITGPILLTGLGTKLPALMIDWASGDLTLLLISAFAACIILGLGVPTSMAYVVVALLVTTPLLKLGVPKLDAHLFVFYASLAAMITPPVALSAYAAAAIAGADYWKTGWLAATLGFTKYLVPFSFVFRPELLMRGSPLEILYTTVLTTVGLVTMSFSFAVPGKSTLRGFSAMLLLSAGGFLLAVPPLDLTLVVAGTACCAVGLILAPRSIWPARGALDASAAMAGSPQPARNGRERT